MANAKVQYFSHSTVLITTETGKRVMLDPWLKGNPKCPAHLQEPDKVDYIILSHGHGDHTDSAVELCKKHKALVFANYELGQLLQQEGVPEEQIPSMNKGGTVEVGAGNGLAVTLTQAFHSSSFTTSKGETKYAGEPCGIVLRLESGRTIYHAGDTLLFGDMKLIGERYRPEIAFLPIGDRYTMGPEDAAHAARLINPKVAVPIHFGTFPALPGTPVEFQRLAAEHDVQVRIVEPGGEFEF